MTQPILPGATLGVLGSGQLGRMFAIAARNLGYGVQVYSPDGYSPAGQIADREWSGAWEDLDRLKEFSKRVQVITLEFENVPVAALNQLEKFVPVRPGPQALEAAQNRLREKTVLRKHGLPTADFLAIPSLEALTAGIEAFGNRGILKTANWGYDGKGQQLITSPEQLDQVWNRFEQGEAILESFIDFEFELSVIAARNSAGEIVCYDPILNHHHNHILDLSIAASPLISEKTSREAKEIAITIMQALSVVGVLCVELFLTRDGHLVVNEIAPRPHNSGHLTIDAHLTSQFEQQVRSICGLPLGSVQLRQPAAMANLLGDLWPQVGQPHWEKALERSDTRLHLYGKSEARIGRKMGHLTCLANDAHSAEAAARAARDSLKIS